MTGVDLRPLLPHDEVESLFVLSNRGRRQVDFVPDPAELPSAGPKFEGSRRGDDHPRLQIRPKFELEIDRAFLGSLEPKDLQGLKSLSNAAELRRHLGSMACCDSSPPDSNFPCEKKKLPKATGLLAVCSDLLVPPGTQEAAAFVTGGNLEIGGEVRGDVVVTAGEATILGSVGGDVWIFGGKAKLGSRGRIAGDVFLIESTVESWPDSGAAGTVYRMTFQEMLADSP